MTMVQRERDQLVYLAYLCMRGVLTIIILNKLLPGLKGPLNSKLNQQISRVNVMRLKQRIVSRIVTVVSYL